MRKITSLLMLFCMCAGMAWGQVYQRIPHKWWAVSALNNARVQGIEGGSEYILDENPETYYHSDYDNNYEGRNVRKGQDGVQAFMVTLPEVYKFDRITYKGRANGAANWATKARIYVFESLPEGLPADLSTLTYDAKEALLNRESGSLTNPAFDNYNEPWAEDREVKTVDFATAQTGKYILFVADAVNRANNNDYLACADFNVWQKIEGIEEDAPYALKIKGVEGNWYLDTKVGESSDFGNTISKTEKSVPAFFTLHNGCWHISSTSGHVGNFVNVAYWDAKPAQSTAADWTLHEVEEDTWCLAQYSYAGGGGVAAQHYLGANGGDIAGNTKIYTDKTITQAVKFELVKLENVEVTFNYYDGETLITTKTSNIAYGSNIELSMAPAIDYFVNSSFKTTGEYIAGDVISVDIACEPNFPFTAMTITDGQFTSDKFYTLTIQNGNRPVVYKNEGNSPVHTKQGNQALAKENLWAFERVAGKPYVVRLYNMVVGATSSLKAKSQNDVAVTFAATDGYTDEFIVRKNGNNFVLICNVENGRDLNACINVGGANNGLGVWGNSHTDAGSTFVIAPASDLADNYTYAAPPASIDDNYASDEYVKYVDTRTSEFVAKVVAYNENKNYATFVDVLDNLPETVPSYGNTISADKFYQLISYNDVNCKGKAVYSISGCGKDGGKGTYFDRDLYIETAVGQRPVAETAFQFITVDGGYKIAHANSDYYFALMSAFNDMATPDLPIHNHGTMVLEPQRDLANVWSIRGNNNTEKYFHCGTGTEKTIVRQDSPATNDGNLWLIKEITEIPVTVGTAKWSTLCLPMAVVVPEDETLKVFYATGVNGEDNLELVEVAAGTVVAKKQAMLIYSTSENESDTYNFTVSTEAGTTFEGSILSGSTARRGNFNTETSEYYGLSKQNDVVAFYPSISAKIPANKAYILNTSLSNLSVKGLYMNWGESTGIGTVVNKKDEIYYDLNGRRVFYPSNGVFITNTGKKVFLK